jgi:glycolate dehydrogenase iron-sulfur subunit
MHIDLSPERLVFPGRGHEHSSLGQCMECGFCTIRCPTFVLLRDERDGPRGRVRFARQIVAEGRPATREAIEHLDRCLSCLGCTSACPYGVDHAGLWDAARAAIEQTKARPWLERLWRRALVEVLTSPKLFTLGLSAASTGRMLRGVLPRKVSRMVDQASTARTAQSPVNQPRVFPAVGKRRMRVALLPGCVQQVLGGSIDAATVSVLTRHGCEVVVAPGAGCCGAVPLHLGFPEQAREHAKRNVTAWRDAADAGLDAVVINASGCGSTVKSYDTLLRDDPACAESARRIASITVDVAELLADLPLEYRQKPGGFPVALHLPCSQQHGQGISIGPQRLLEEAGFEVCAAPESHMCCGAAGTYSLTEPEISDRLGERKARALDCSGAKAIATGNMNCLLHIARFSALPIVHAVELLDWVTGGGVPERLRSMSLLP